jgi:hypothetical protein
MLLESKPIGREDAYKRIVEVVLERYLTGDHGWTHSRTELGVPRFLYNDIARYWRTVTVDFAYKQWTRDNKGWALRKAKLRLARKLTYAAGMLYCFSLAEGVLPSARDAERSRKQKAIERLWNLTTRTPLDLLAEAFMMSDSLQAPARKAFDAYDQFLGMLNDQDVRDHLENLRSDEGDSDEQYNRARKLGAQFQDGLTTLFVLDRSTAYPSLTAAYGVF